MKLQTCSACQDLPTLQFWSKFDYLSWSYCPFFINFFLILILFVLYFKNYLEIDVKLKLQKCAACQDLPTLQFWSKSHYPFWPIMQIRKKGGWNFKKFFSSETTVPISTKLCWNEPWVVPFQNCVRQCRPVSKMAAMTKNRNFFKWPKLLYFKPESAQIWTV